MASTKKPNSSDSDRVAVSPGAQSPDWADGLKQLYDAVVDEPLPDAFKDLLDKLDEANPDSDGAS